jgi:hypothetical protein
VAYASNQSDSDDQDEQSDYCTRNIEKHQKPDDIKSADRCQKKRSQDSVLITCASDTDPCDRPHSVNASVQECERFHLKVAQENKRHQRVSQKPQHGDTAKLFHFVLDTLQQLPIGDRQFTIITVAIACSRLQFAFAVSTLNCPLVDLLAAGGATPMFLSRGWFN